MRSLLRQTLQNITKHVTRRAAIVTLLAICTVLNTIAAPLMPSANAADQPLPPIQQATSWWYYQAVSECAQHASFQITGNDSDSHVRSGSWVADYSGGSAVGYFMRDSLVGIGDDGSINCNEGQSSNESVFQKAFALWNLNPIDVVCDGGILTRSDNQPCKEGRSTFEYAKLDGNLNDQLMSYIKAHVFNNQEPSLQADGSAPQYIYDYTTFKKSCAYNQATLASKPDSGDQSKIYSVIEPTGKPAWYVAALPQDTQVQYRPNGDSKITCLNLVNQINDNANAYAVWVAAHPSVQDVPADSKSCTDSGACKDTSKCQITGIGWIVCPVVYFLASITDGAYEKVSEMLVVPPVDTTLNLDGTNPLYAAWSMMRNFANVVFVIAFMIIIYSQITGGGLANYTIKKMLPRIIVAAVLVNLSYWICAAAVDLSNIAGSSLKSLFDTLSNNYKVPSTAGFGDLFAGNNMFGNMAGVLLAGSATIAFAIVYPAIFLPLLIAALAAIVAVVVTLTLRAGLIIVLIVVSPLAFVAYLLPNTESLFKRWMQLFQALLVMFPVIAVVFGVSAFAGKIIMASAKGSVLVQIMGAGVVVIPLFLVPALMKLGGGMLNRFAGVVNDRHKGVFDGMRNRAKEIQENSAYMRGRKARLSLRQSRKNREFADRFELGRKLASGETGLTKADGTAYSDAELLAARVAYHRARGPMAQVDNAAGRALGSLQNSSSPFAQYVGAKGSQAYGATGAAGRQDDLAELSSHYKAQVEKATAEGLREAMQTLGKELAAHKAGGGTSDDFLVDIAKNQSRTHLERAAAVHELARQGRDGKLRELRDSGEVSQSIIQEAIGANVGSLAAKAPDLVKGEGPAFGNVKGSQLAEFSKYTAQAYMKHLDSIKGTDGYDTALKNLNAAITDIKNDSALQGKFDSEVGFVLVDAKANHNIDSGGAINGTIDPTTKKATSGDFKIR